MLEVDTVDVVLIAIPLNPAKEIAVIRDGKKQISSVHPGYLSLLDVLRDACDERLGRLNAMQIPKAMAAL